MASVSVPGIHGWGNLSYPSLRGALGLSLCHRGGSAGAFLLDRVVAVERRRYN